jgi:nicotinate dehydrogenase subunit B
MKKGDTINQGSSINIDRSGMPRRDFFKILGGGIIIFFQPWGIKDLFASTAEQQRSLPKDYNAFLRIAEDGTVSLFTGKVEMGQGIITSLPQIMADELNVKLESIKMIMGDTDLCPWDAGTWGSLSIRAFSPFMRAAAAEAKGVLLELASEKLGVPVAQLEAKDGVITSMKDPKKSVTYAQLAKGQRIERFLDVKPGVEDYTKFNYVNKSYKHADALAKVTGEAKYAGDLKLPGMVYARILRPPSHGAKLTSADVSGAEKVPGTQVVRDNDFIAVLNEKRDRADEAIVKIKAEYTFNELPVNDKNLFESMLKAETTPRVVRTNGDLETGRQLSTQIFESEFHDPYVAHSPMETHTALARIEGDKITVWAGTQSPFGLQDSIVRALGLPIEKVRVITPFIGGGFGGKAPSEQGVEAARLAKMTGKPVMVVWTRDEEFFYDSFHPAGVIKVKSGIDNSGMIKLWDYNIYFSGTRGSETTYDVPHATTTSHNIGRGAQPMHPFATGAWRAPNNNTNCFAREVQVDIMAKAAGIDPLEFRLKNLKDKRMIDCLKTVAEKFGYVPGKTPTGRGIGVACGEDVESKVAHIAEVKVDKTTGKVQVLRVTCVQDMGLCVNPEGSILQMEGCITMGLGYALTEEIFFEGGKIADRGFDTYQIPRFSWLPKIETIILDRKDQPPHGGGEPAIINIGAVISNAIFDATGARMYTMPMTPARVLEALKKA